MYSSSTDCASLPCSAHGTNMVLVCWMSLTPMNVDPETKCSWRACTVYSKTLLDTHSPSPTAHKKPDDEGSRDAKTKSAATWCTDFAASKITNKKNELVSKIGLKSLLGICYLCYSTSTCLHYSEYQYTSTTVEFAFTYLFQSSSTRSNKNSTSVRLHRHNVTVKSFCQSVVIRQSLCQYSMMVVHGYSRIVSSVEYRYTVVPVHSQLEIATRSM